MISNKNSGNLPSAKPVLLGKLVDYAPNSIVSRTIKKSKQGTLTLFAFDAGEELSEHSAPFDAFVQILDGEAEIIIDNKPVKTSVGETILMPANVPHAVVAQQKFKMLLIMIRG